MKTLAILTLLLGSAGLAHGQGPEHRTFIPSSAVHAVPLSSQGNTLKLPLSGFGAAGDLRVVAREVPPALRLEPASQLVAVQGSDAPSVSFSFDVAPSAALDDTLRVLIDFTSADGRAWTKEVRLKVAPPAEVVLHQNFPNPFRNTTRIGFSLPSAGRVRLTVYNVLGQRVAELLDEERPAGYNSIEWNSANAVSGVYFYRLEAEGRVLQDRMLLVR